MSTKAGTDIGIAPFALSILGGTGKFGSDLMGTFGRRAMMADSIQELKVEKASTIGAAAAKSGASGVEGSSSSTQDYLAGLGAQFDKAIAKAEDAKGLAFASGLIGAGAGLLGGGAGAYSAFAALNNWWKD